MSKMKEAMHDQMEKKIRHFQKYWTRHGMLRAAEQVERFPCADASSQRKLKRVGALLRRKANELRGEIKYEDLSKHDKKLVDAYPEFVMTELEQDAWFTLKVLLAFFALIAVIGWVILKTCGGAA